MATNNVIKSPRGAAAEYAKHSFSAYKRCVNGCTYCVSPDTILLTPNLRPKRIADVEIGEQIYGANLEGHFNKYVLTEVIAKRTVTDAAYRIILEDGTELVCSRNHRWLTNRGWKYTTNNSRGIYRSFITTNNIMSGISLYKVPNLDVTEDYMKGYLAGITHGDANFKEYHYEDQSLYPYRLVIKEEDAIIRTR